MINKKDPHRYDDMIYLERPSSPRKKMSILERSAQFAPFAALTGHNEAILETQRLTDEKIILSEEAKNDISFKLNILEEHILHHPKIKVIYYMADERKEGGSYKSIIENLKKIDTYEKQLIFVNHKRIPIEDVISIESDLFLEY